MDVNCSTFSKPQLILLAHGSRDRNWCRTFESGLQVINRSLEKDASLAYMEMAEPGLETVIAGHFLEGKRDFQLLPLFFAAGRHLRKDVPEMIEELQARYNGTTIELLEPVGEQDGFWQGVAGLITDQYPLQMFQENNRESTTG